jgi:8-oxo-dGTP pyrophosphatase MutT (NUDIX family)
MSSNLDSEARTHLQRILAAHHAEDERELKDLQRMRDYAVTLEQPFARSQPEAHFTASAVLVGPAGLETCLVHHRKLNRWLQPGGHFEPSDNGSPVRAALREVLEETGCAGELVAGAAVPFDVDIHGIPASGAEPAHLHLDLRLLACTAHSELAIDAIETRGAEWLNWEAALERADDPALQRLLRKARRLLGT